MKINCSHQRNRALTLLEVLVIIFVLIVLAVIVLPANHGNSRSIARRIACQNNLKQLVLSFKIWPSAQDDRYPMQVSVTNGGTMELMNTPDAWKVFQAMSVELNTPKIIHCPADTVHADIATNFSNDLQNKISYFIGLDASEANPNAIISGDGNFLLNRSLADHGFVNASTNDTLAWDTSRHVSTHYKLLYKIKVSTGNIARSDGSVQSTTERDLAIALQQTGFPTNRIFIP